MVAGGCCGINQVSLGIKLMVWSYTHMLALLCYLLYIYRDRFVTFESPSNHLLFRIIAGYVCRLCSLLEVDHLHSTSRLQLQFSCNTG